MLNKRLLIKNLLAYNDENSFYDKKVQLNLDSKEGKAKFLKAFAADIFFDDQKGHCESAKEYVTAGHVLHGVTNE